MFVHVSPQTVRSDLPRPLHAFGQDWLAFSRPIELKSCQITHFSCCCLFLERQYTSIVQGWQQMPSGWHALHLATALKGRNSTGSPVIVFATQLTPPGFGPHTKYSTEHAGDPATHHDIKFGYLTHASRQHPIPHPTPGHAAAAVRNQR